MKTLNVKFFGLPLGLWALLLGLLALTWMSSLYRDDSSSQPSQPAAGAASQTPLDQAIGKANNAAGKAKAAIDSGDEAKAKEAVDELETEYDKASGEWLRLEPEQRLAKQGAIENLDTLLTGVRDSYRAKFGN